MTGLIKRNYFLAIIIAAAFVSLAPAKAENVTNDVFVHAQYYVWNRFADLLEILRGGVAVGPTAGLELAITEHAQLGAYYSNETGVTFPHFLPPLWIVPKLEEDPIFKFHKGEYHTYSYGPRREESSNQRDVRFERQPWEIRAQAGLGLVHLFASLNLVETADFLLGFFFVDIQKDDKIPFAEKTRQPGRQLGRSIVNIITGPLEIPFNVHIITKQEGDVAGISYGLLRGIWRFAVREVVGVTELITFPLGYDPILYPAFPFKPQRSTDWRLTQPPFMRDY